MTKIKLLNAYPEKHDKGLYLIIFNYLALAKNARNNHS